MVTSRSENPGEQTTCGKEEDMRITPSPPFQGE